MYVFRNNTILLNFLDLLLFITIEITKKKNEGYGELGLICWRQFSSIHVEVLITQIRSEIHLKEHVEFAPHSL